MPTTSEGRDGFKDLILSAVFPLLPPMTRSYSRPNWPRTLAMAARMRLAFSSLRKSKNGSLTQGLRCKVVRGPTGTSSVAMMHLGGNFSVQNWTSSSRNYDLIVAPVGRWSCAPTPGRLRPEVLRPLNLAYCD